MKNIYTLEGLSCANCAIKIESSIKDLPDVESATLNFATKTLTVTGKNENLKEIKNIIKKIEPQVRLINDNEEITKKSKWDFPFIAGVFLFGLAFFLTENLRFIGFLFAYLLIGYEVIIKALLNLKRLKPFDENFLMFIATIGAFAIGEYPEGVAVMLFYKVGEYFQDKAVESSQRNIAKLMDIKPEYANKLSGGEEQKVNPSDVKVGDIIIVRAGEKIPLDGSIVKGSGLVDLKSLTGESMPKEVVENEKVLSGSINLRGILEIKVEKEYSESTVYKILDLVENSAQNKAKTENFITKFAEVYTPIVVLIALVISVIPPIFIGFESFYSWLYKGLIFLVISCPCALILSVPLGFFAGIGASSKQGILVKGGNYLDALTNIEKIIFDKTGTLTRGEFEVTGIVANKAEKEELLEIAAYAECNSNHPIAQSVLKKYSGIIDKTRIDDYEELAGLGIKLLFDKKVLLAGNSKLMDLHNIDYGEINSDKTAILIAYEQEFLGYIEIADVLKAESEDAVSSLNKLGIETIMLTGDKKEVAKDIGNKLKIKKVYSELLPMDKVKILEELINRSSGNIAFVGDGINDAPALKISDIGISMGGVGSDAAIEASDIVLLTDNLSLITKAIKIAKKTRKIVIQNISMSLFVKISFLILAIFSLSNMWTAVFADVGISLIAVLNSMRALITDT